MANYYATARSNYFAVKDAQAFRDWADGLGLTILEPDPKDKAADGIVRFGIAPGDDDGGSWPTSLSDAETGYSEDIDVAGQLSAHVADDEVAVLIEVGNEKLRYMTGFAVAVNSHGAFVVVDLETIYEAALTLGSNITRAEY